jgi:DNA-binding CsgD family transcriptional regulator
MIKEDYAGLLDQLPVGWKAPDGFFENIFLQENSYCFLLNCTGERNYYQMGTPCEELTGFNQEDYAKGGIEFWFSRIHPEDIPLVTDAILEGFSQLVGLRGQSGSPVLIRMRYRFKEAEGSWLNTIDTRFLFSLHGDGLVDKMLCKIEVIDDHREEIKALKIISEKDSARNQMLAHALELKSREGILRKNKNDQSAGFINSLSSEQPLLTIREKEILQLISDGLSTKMIADKCFISIHTVETHRKHLLEKLDVRNSMELVKKASKYFWL